MVMTLEEMRSFVRSHADADTTDAPDANLNIYARIGYNDILSRRNVWPNLAATYTLTTVAGQSSYPLSGLSTNNLELVGSVIDTTNLGRRLIYMSQSDGDIAFGAPVGMTAATATAYTIVNTSIVIYPTPSVSGKVYTVRGWRKADTWPTSAGSYPDLPGSLHEPIAWFMLSNYFLSQEDTQLAGLYLQEYNTMVERFLRAETTKEFAGRPLVMGGQNYQSIGLTRWVRGALE
jgi:hypothetical protein